MKAVQYDAYGDESVLELVELPDPVPAAGEVLIDIKAAGVNPFDWKLRAGHLKQFFAVDFPVVPGGEGAGLVASVGEGVTNFTTGDAVSFMARETSRGAYAECVAVPVGHVAAMSDNIEFSSAAAFPVSAVSAWKCLVECADVQPGMKVLIHGGAGGVGGLAIQLAKHLGADVATTCSATNADYVRSLGADRVVSYDEADFAEELSKVDVVLDSIGGDTHHRSYQVLKPGGTLVFLIAKPFEDRAAEFDVNLVRAVVEDVDDAFAAMADLVNRDVVVPQVEHVLPLADVREAHKISQTGHARGKIVLRLGD